MQGCSKHVHKKLNLCSALLSSTRRAEAAGRTGRALASLCLPGTLRYWEPGDDFESVTLASAGGAKCWAKGAWKVLMGGELFSCFQVAVPWQCGRFLFSVGICKFAFLDFVPLLWCYTGGGRLR